MDHGSFKFYDFIYIVPILGNILILLLQWDSFLTFFEGLVKPLFIYLFFGVLWVYFFWPEIGTLSMCLLNAYIFNNSHLLDVLIHLLFQQPY